jgi:hypothetical protein
MSVISRIFTNYAVLIVTSFPKITLKSEADFEKSSRLKHKEKLKNAMAISTG